MKTVTGWMLALCVLGLPVAVVAQPQTRCTIEPHAAFRGDRIRIQLPGDTRAQRARVTLEPTPKKDGDTTYGQTSSSFAIEANSIVYTVDDKAPLGRYRLNVAPDDGDGSTCDLLVALPVTWRLALSEFDPSGTFDVRPVKVRRNNTDVAVKAISLSLRGRNFITDVPDDNRIYINRMLRPVTWDGCPVTASKDPLPDPIPIHGGVTNSEQIELCQVEVPDRHRIVTVEVSQDNVPRSELRYFRLYWWDRKIVGTVAGVVAILLAALVLGLVRTLKRSQRSEAPLNVLQILFLDPETDTYSLSKLQFYLWTFAAIFGYAYLAISRLFIQGERWPDIPDGLPAVIALGAGTAVGAQIVQTTRGPKGGGAETPNLGDFVTSGGVAAPERVQMLVWTIVGVAVFMYAVLQHGPEEIQALDPVPSGLLTMMGLSSLGYLGGKLARGAGPIINELSIVPADSDQTLESETQAPLPDFTVARSLAGQASARLAVAGGAAAQPALAALAAGIAAVRQATTLTAIEALLPTLAAEVAKVEAAAAAAAAAIAQPTPPADATQAAQTAQGAAAALQDLVAAVRAVVGERVNTSIRRDVTRVIELRGRNLSDQALFSIDQTELPFRMLRPNADGKQIPEVVIREKNDPNLAVVLRLTIDAGRLEEPDLRRYRIWFGGPSTKPKTFSVINLDGQRAEISFSVPPAMAQQSSEPGGATR